MVVNQNGSKLKKKQLNIATNSDYNFMKNLNFKAIQ